MKEQLHTIPISDAMANAGECPFCYIERKTEEHMMDFVLGHGASYMEADIRDMTDRAGFCRSHFKKIIHLALLIYPKHVSTLFSPQFYPQNHVPTKTLQSETHQVSSLQ